jgi:perosamine synthetase
MKVPQVQPWLGPEEAAAVRGTIEASWITEGPQTAVFGERLNALMGAEYGAFAPNGTLALLLGLLALEIGPGDEVLVPDTTFIGSATSVMLAGATPVFVEVNQRNFQVDVSRAEALVTPRTRAIMPVHLYGMVANMTEVMAFSERYGLRVIEDAAQAVGVRYEGRHAGTFGDVGCFSFFADKTITTGEGGYVVCRTEEVHEKLLCLRNQGRRDRGSFIHPTVGYNFRMTDMQAAVGVAQLARLDRIIERKRTILGWYRDELDGVEPVTFLDVEPGSEFVPFRVVLIGRDAHGLMAFLEERGVSARTFFHPMHKQPCFAHLGRARGGPLDLDDSAYPNATYGYDHGVCLPVFPELSREQVEYVCAGIREFYGA